MAIVKDPVCGMEIDTKQAAATVTHKEQPYHFCSSMCKTKFTMNPAKYTGSHGSSHTSHHNH